MQTLSKAWGLAALRLGLCYASLDIIDLFNKVKPPYNINDASQQLALEALQNTDQINDWITDAVEQRAKVIRAFSECSFVENIYPSDANFILIKVANAMALYTYLAEHEVVVRNRSKDPGCDNCLRITIGNAEENNQLIQLFKSYEQ
jgi:histidinol-phosphate aminotransferase